MRQAAVARDSRSTRFLLQKFLTRSTATLVASSTGLLLKTLGYNVTAIKIDPYMNIDAGTMSPTEHGKSFTCLEPGSPCGCSAWLTRSRAAKQARCLFSTTAARPTWTWATTSGT